MSELLQQIIMFIQTHAAGLVTVTGAGDLMGLGIGTILIILVLLYVTFYTIKKVVVNLVLGYITLYLVQYILHIAVEPTGIMIALMALFGPIPVIIAAGWHLIV